MREWEAHPCTLTLFRFYQALWLDRLRDASSVEDLAVARGIQYAIESGQAMGIRLAEIERAQREAAALLDVDEEDMEDDDGDET